MSAKLQNPQTEQTPQTKEGPPSPPTGHEKHCFVVMPSGREPDEVKWFKGWYEVVIKPAVLEAGFDPVLAAAEEQPGAINDEIRTHLALDPMVVVDLGGAEVEDDPNPNVMYELGIRHALGLPLVMLAWKGQRLPFDVGNQRVIMEGRDLIDLEMNRKKIVAFTNAAREGRYYRPMEAVSRMATIQAASTSLGEDSLLRALALEVRDMRTAVSAVVQFREARRYREEKMTFKKLIKSYRKDLYPHFIASGGNTTHWAKLLRSPMSEDFLQESQEWKLEQWQQYVAAKAKEFPPLPPPPPSKDKAEDKSAVDEQTLTTVQGLLPAQPWPTGIHKEIAVRLGISNRQAAIAINELVRRGIFQPQAGGEISEDEIEKEPNGSPGT
jgi:hypothetical protein